MTILVLKNSEGTWVQAKGIQNLNDTQLDMTKVEKLFVDGSWTQENLDQYGLKVAVPFELPSGYRFNGIPYYEEDENGIINQIYPVEEIPLSEIKSEKLALLDQKRWEVEVGGMNFGPFYIRTDANSTAKMTAAFISAALDPNYMVPNWEVSPGNFVTLDNQTILALGTAVRQFIQSTFDHKKDLADQIEAAQNVQELDAIDIYDGWTT